MRNEGAAVGPLSVGRSVGGDVEGAAEGMAVCTAQHSTARCSATRCMSRAVETVRTMASSRVR